MRGVRSPGLKEAPSPASAYSRAVRNGTRWGSTALSSCLAWPRIRGPVNSGNGQHAG